MGLESGVGELLGTRPRTYNKGSGRKSVVIQTGEPEAERRADPGEPQGRVENDTRRRVSRARSGTVGPGRWLESYGYMYAYTPL